MVEQIVFAILAAAGIVLFVWCLFGWVLMPANDDTVTLVFATKAEQLEHDVRLWLWLKSVGVQSGRLIAVDRMASEIDACAAEKFCGEKDVEFCSEAELPLLLGLE